MAFSLPTDGKTTLSEPVSAQSIAPPKFQTTVIWAVVACLLLGASAVVRNVQDKRHTEESNYTEACPFPIEQLPRTLGRWKNIGDEQKLDNTTLKITGGKEYTIRTYTDETTGVKLVVLLLFGPMEPVIPHVPELCYPANGFQRQDQPLNRTVIYKTQDASGKEEEHKSVFRSAVYGKGQMLEGVYHSFRFLGDWTPDPGAGQKLSRRKPGIFKVQIQRLVVPGESRDGEKYPDPIEDFLKSFLPAVEQQISQEAAKTGSKSVATQ